MATCRSCGAPVVWAKTSAGKMMPLDANEDGTLTEFPDGNLVVVNGAVEVTASGVYRSHFSSCPEAKNWRKQR